jgi:phage-related minor tail protein
VANEIDVEVRGRAAGAARALADTRRDVARTTADVRDLGKAGKDAGRELGDGVERGAKEATAALDKTKAAAKDTAAAVEQASARAGAAVSEQARGIGDSLTEALTSSSPMAGPAVAAVGGAFIGAISLAIKQADIRAAFEASLDPAVAGHAGQAAGQLYARGVRASLEEVTEAIGSLFQNDIVDVDDSIYRIEELGRRALATAKVTGERVQDISRAVTQMIRTDLVDSAEEGMDLIVAAQQAGLNRSEDLVDTLTEYGTQFRKVGLDGQQSLGLISQALKGGARDSDVAADAIKEFTLITASGSAEAASALEALGMDAQGTFAKLSAGGQPAASALNEVLINLRQVRDPADRARIAVELFGTKAEDLGDSLYDMDLSTATAEFHDFQDAAERAADQMENTPGAEFGQMWRGIEENVVKAGDAVASFLTSSSAMDEMRAHIEETRKAQEAQARAAEEQKEAAEGSTQAFYDQEAALDALIKKNSEYHGDKIDAIEAELRYQESVDDANAALAANGETLDQSTEKGRANWNALLDMANATQNLTESMRANGSNANELNGVIDRSRSAFIALADKMGYSKTQAESLANQLIGMSRPYRSSFEVDTSRAYANLFGLDKYLAAMTRPRNVAVNVNVRTGATPFAFAHGGIMPSGPISHRANGGPAGGWTWLHEQGPELVKLPPGTQVASNPDSERMMAAAARGGGRVVLEIHSGGTPMDDLLVEVLRRAVREQGGDVQLVLGSG